MYLVYSVVYQYVLRTYPTRIPQVLVYYVIHNMV